MSLNVNEIVFVGIASAQKEREPSKDLLESGCWGWDGSVKCSNKGTLCYNGWHQNRPGMMESARAKVQARASMSVSVCSNIDI